MVDEDGERVACGHVLATVNRKLLDDKRLAAAARRHGAGRPHHDRSEKCPRADDRIDLRLGEAVQEKRLPLRELNGFEFLEFVPPLEEHLCRYKPLGDESLEPGDLAMDHIDLNGCPQEIGLGLHELLMGEANLKKRLIGSDGLPLGHQNLREVSRHGRDGVVPRPTSPLHHHAGNRHGALIRGEHDLPFLEANTLAGLRGELNGALFRVPRMIVAVLIGMPGFVRSPCIARSIRRLLATRHSTKGADGPSAHGLEPCSAEGNRYGHGADGHNGGDEKAGSQVDRHG